MQYAAPETTAEATRLLADSPGTARVLAGGTDLLVQMKFGGLAPDLLVDIKNIKGMRDVTPEDGGFRVGAAVSGAEMGEHKAMRALWPGVVEAVELIGSTQVQGRATMAGNLCNASPAADSVPAMVAANAIARIAGPDGERDCPVQDIPTAPGKTSLQKGEFITSIFFPARPDNASDAYLRFIPRTEMDIAVCSAGVSLTLDTNGTCTDARVSLGAVAATVLLVQDAANALIGSKLDDSALEALGAACSAACNPIDDKRGTIEFRRDVTAVLAKRAAKIAQSRAGERS
ncbi:MAG: xanthine dehydrogenase family protein subunit M [Alphaproteobacteria bacterium]|nr:xanthine dehydrogenase family protein subunit M [Alphaproteobacteria bacterium]